MELKNKRMYDIVSESCKKYKNNIALVCNDQEVSYNNLLNSIDLLARSLNSVGVKKSKVNVCLNTSVEAIYLFFALNKLGAVINYINYDLDNKYIEECINNNILIIDEYNMDKYYDIIKNKDISKIILVGEKNYDIKNILKWSEFISLNNEYKDVNIKYKDDEEIIINYYKDYNDNIVSVHINNKSLINSIDTFLDSALEIKKKNIININPMYDHIGYNINVLIPLIKGMKIIIGNKNELIDLIKQYKINYLFTTEDIMYEITKFNTKIKLDSILIISKLIDDHKINIINSYVSGLKIKVYRAYSIPEINNLVGLKMEIDIKLIDVIDYSDTCFDIGNLLIKSDDYCKTYINGKELKLDSNGYFKTGYIAMIDSDDNLIIVDTLEKEIERRNMYKTGLASIDMPWLKYFPIESRNEEVAKMTVYEYLKEVNKDNYLEVALSYMGKNIKYYEMFNNIEMCAKSLKALGVKKGDYITICMPNIPEFVYVFYAINKIGAIACLIEPRTPASRVKDYLDESNSKVLIMVDLCKNNIDKIVDNVKSLKTVVSVSPIESITSRKIKVAYNLTHKKYKYTGKYISYKEFIKAGESFDNIKSAKFVERETAVVVYTSGTTGKPKGACLPNETLNGQNMQLKYSGICPKVGEVFLGNVPFFSAYGSSVGMHNALSSGITVALIPSYKPTDFPKLIQKNRPTHAMGVPRFFEILANSKIFKGDELKFLRNSISGGDKMTPSKEYYVNEYLINHGSEKLKKGLGMSEFGGGYITTVNKDINRPGSVGIPHVGNNVKIIDINTRKEVTYGRDKKTGELYVTGPTMMNGYLNREEENEKFFEIDDNGVKWAKTGDLVYMDQDGAIFFIDRIKNVIMRPDGHTVPLLPIENAIDKCEDVFICAVVGTTVDSKGTGKMPMAYIVLKKNRDKSTLEIHKEIKRLVSELVPEREQPKWYRYVDNIPLNLAGKVDMLKLEKMSEKDNNKSREYLNLEKNSDK